MIWRLGYTQARGDTGGEDVWRTAGTKGSVTEYECWHYACRLSRFAKLCNAKSVVPKNMAISQVLSR